VTADILANHDDSFAHLPECSGVNGSGLGDDAIAEVVPYRRLGLQTCLSG
jgi:hypothetical protein